MTKCAELANLIGNINAGGGGVGRNIVINGNFAIAQRSASVTGITSGDTYHTVDRFMTRVTTAGTWTQTQSTDTPTGKGLSYSLKMACTTADSSLGASDTVQIQHRIEGLNLQHLKYGTSDALPLTISFYVKAVKTGINIVSLYMDDGNDGQSQSYTINSSNTWEFKTVRFTGNTGQAIANDNTRSMIIQFHLASGSNFQSGTLATSWAEQSTANEAVGQVNHADSTSNTWQIAGLQMEVGQNPTEFEHEKFSQTLEKCQRYFYKENYTAGSNTTGPFACQYTDTHRFIHLFHPTTMRTTPTSTVSSNQSVTEYQSTERNYKSYIAHAYDSASSIHLTAFQADAEL
tara:strand:- start:1535 stop:2572 length:1038 start_codon:yes stop_codon:yes gene_type:complete